MQGAADFLREAPFIVFAFAFGLPALLAAAMGWAALWSRRNARALAAMAETTVDRLAAGPCLASGRTPATSGLKAPLTGRPCIWAEAVVDRVVERRDSDGKDRRLEWQRVREEVTERPVRIEWNGAAATADPEGATVFHSGWSEWYGPDETPGTPDPEIRPGTESFAGGGRFEVLSDPARRFRFRERYILPGDPVFVLGEARPGKGGFTIGPAAGRPYLISTRSPDAIGSESRQALTGGLIMAAIFAAVAIAVAWLRFA